MKFTIVRPEWSRGENDSMLVRTSDGKKCCLGFFLLACGVPRMWIEDVGEPHEPFGRIDRIPDEAAFLATENPKNEDGLLDESKASRELIAANDDKMIDETTREKKIADLFSQHGHEVVFVDDLQVAS